MDLITIFQDIVINTFGEVQFATGITKSGNIKIKNSIEEKIVIEEIHELWIKFRSLWRSTIKHYGLNLFWEKMFFIDLLSGHSFVSKTGTYKHNFVHLVLVSSQIMSPVLPIGVMKT